MRTQVKSLTNSVRRLETLIERKELPEVGKRVVDSLADENGKKARRTTTKTKAKTTK